MDRGVAASGDDLPSACPAFTFCPQLDDGAGQQQPQRKRQRQQALGSDDEEGGDEHAAAAEVDEAAAEQAGDGAELDGMEEDDLF